VQPRPFTEVAALCTLPSGISLNVDTPPMTSVFSGGLVYEWTQEPSNYGLVDLSDGKITVRQDYNNLKAEYLATPNPQGDGGYNPSGTSRACPANTTEFMSWRELPRIPPGAQEYIDHGAGTPLGFNGPSNMNMGGSVWSQVGGRADGRLLVLCRRGRSSRRVRSGVRRHLRRVPRRRGLSPRVKGMWFKS
jgi:Glucanosyltransferase